MKRSILYLDDEPEILTIFEEMFGDSYNIRTVTDIEGAMGELERESADIIISDQRMPGALGTDFLREVAGSYPGSYRVMITGSVRAGDVIRDISSGVINLFISKPWTEESMTRALDRASKSFELRNRLGHPQPASTQYDCNSLIA